MSNQLTLAQICLLRQGAANATSRRVVDRIVRLNFLQRNGVNDKSMRPAAVTHFRYQRNLSTDSGSVEDGR